MKHNFATQACHPVASTPDSVAAGDAFATDAAEPRCKGLSAASIDSRVRWQCIAPFSIINPQSTPATNETQCQTEHFVCEPPSGVPTRKEVVVWLPGTDLVPQNYSLLIKAAARLGFRTLGLLYPSTQGQVNCKQSRVPYPTDLNCTAKERYRVLTGAPTSPNTNITPPDSIVGRISAAFAALRWQDANADVVDWGNMIIAGHSNGADHAAFLAKHYAVSRAALFAGPQDYVGLGGHDDPAGAHPAPAAPWQHERGATDPNRLFGFGIAGSAAHPNSWECYTWHIGWEAEQMRRPYVQVDAGLRANKTDGWTGARRLVSDGSFPSPINDLDPWWHAHMGAGGDCCSPRQAGSRGKLLVWNPVLEHMLLSNLSDGVARGAKDEPTGCGNLSTTVPPPPPLPTPPQFDFRGFEANVLPAYLPRFKVAGAGPAGYGAVPHPTEATPYGARAAVKALYISNQLNISDAQRDGWKGFFDSFQNKTGLWGNYSKTGLDVKPFDTLYLGAWEMTDAYGLVGRLPKYNNSMFEAIASNPSAWDVNFSPIFNGTQAGCSTIHGCGHKVAAIGVVLAATGHAQMYASFFKWLLAHAKAHLDPATGEICPTLCKQDPILPECSKTLYDCLGGGMTYHSMLTYLEVPWPDSPEVQQLALRLQKADGLWSYMSDSMNFDGIYQLSRPCRQHSCSQTIIVQIEAACSKYVAAAHKTLADLDSLEAVFDSDFHHFPVCLATVAECQSWFPQMVRTLRPWRTQTFP